MRYKIPKTLDYYLSTPFFKKVDLSRILLAQVTKQCRSYMDSSPGQETPGQEALRLYTLNHLVSLIRQVVSPYEELPDWADQIVNAYQREVASQAQRMFFYSLLITTRESRHSGKVMKTSLRTELDAITPTWGRIYDEISGMDSMEAANIFMGYDASYFEGCTLLNYLKAVNHVFNRPWGGSYGGPPWATVSTNLIRMVSGQTSMEMMVDTGYTLAHNGGPIFNKGMMYKMNNTNAEKEPFLRLLDVQRSGQMAELVLDPKFKTYLYGYSIPDDIKVFVESARDNMGGFGSVVDWDKVKAAGAVSKLEDLVDDEPQPVVLGEFVMIPKSGGLYPNKVQIVSNPRPEAKVPLAPVGKPALKKVKALTDVDMSAVEAKVMVAVGSGELTYFGVDKATGEDVSVIIPKVKWDGNIDDLPTQHLTLEPFTLNPSIHDSMTYEPTTKDAA